MDVVEPTVPVEHAARSVVLDESSARVGRPRRTGRGRLMRLAGLTVFAAVCALIGALLGRGPRFWRANSHAGRAAATVAGRLDAAPPSSALPASSNVAPGAPVPTADAAPQESSWETTLQPLLDQVVSIESRDEAGEACLGAGFVVDASGLVATSFHVLAEATTAQARFRDGAAYDILGYVVARPEDDLAIVRLASPPANLRPVRWAAAAPAPLAEVVALGHPQGLVFSPSNGRVSRVLRTSELPPRSRQFVRELVSPVDDQRWIQHTALLSEGNSGGPLINRRGEVVGVNTWVDGPTGFGYAIDALTLRELVDERQEAVTPLERWARPSARVARVLREVSPERIRALCDQADAFEWTPADEEQYATLQELAWCLTVAGLPSTFTHSETLAERLPALVAEQARVRERLRGRRWDGLGQLTLLNELAQPWLDSPLAGVAVIAVVRREVQGADGRRGLLLQVDDRWLFVPLDTLPDHPPPGEHCLVLGVNYHGQHVVFGDNPLQLTRAPVIISEFLAPWSVER